MIRCPLVVLLAMAITAGAWADQPPDAKADSCLVINNRILGPRTPGQLLPLSRGDPAHGFHTACALPWSKLSPSNAALPITDCYPGGLLQVATDAACGRQTGPLWVSSRWVVTSAQLQDTQTHAVICQQLETGTWAGTRDLKFDCLPRKIERRFELAPPPKAPTQPAKSTAPAPGVPAAPPSPAATPAPAATPPHS